MLGNLGVTPRFRKGQGMKKFRKFRWNLVLCICCCRCVSWVDKQLSAVAALVQESFDISKQKPVHPTNPDLVPTQIIPIFPDHDRWVNQYVQVAFDTDPCEGETSWWNGPKQQVNSWESNRSDNWTSKTKNRATRWYWHVLASHFRLPYPIFFCQRRVRQRRSHVCHSSSRKLMALIWLSSDLTSTRFWRFYSIFLVLFIYL